MSTAVRPRTVELENGSDDGGRPARQAITRWAWRLFRREWRRQALILVLLALSVAATTVGLGVVANSVELKADPFFGSANTILSIPGDDPSLSADVSAIQARFRPSDVVEHQSIPIPGSVATLDIRAESPTGTYTRATLRLDRGRFPKSAGEAAVTSEAAGEFGLHIGSVWRAAGGQWQIVGLVENPLNLLDEFALVAPGQDPAPDQVSVLVNADQNAIQNFRLPGHNGLNIESRGTGGKTLAEVLVLVLMTLSLMFVGLLAVAGFTVMAQRRMRALGMLGSLGATDRNIRLVMMANGAAVGATAAVAGTLTGVVAWLAFAPTLQTFTSHRVDPFNIPWWGVGAAMALAFVTSVLAAWWPARSVARIPVMAALSGRPPRPQPAHRFAAAGGIILGTGLTLLAFADRNRAGFIIGGTIASVVGLLFMAPLAIRAFAAAGRGSTIAVRLALRDLGRYQARSGAALGAITLAIGISATIAISASAAAVPTGPGNLPANQLVVYASQGGPGSPVPLLSSDQLQSAQAKVDQMAGGLGARNVVALEEAYNPQAGSQVPGPGGGPGGSGYPPAALADVSTGPRGGINISALISLYVATPAVLSHYGISSSQLDQNANILTSQKNLAGLQIFTPGGLVLGANRKSPPVTLKPVTQVLNRLPVYSSDPDVLITPQAMQSLGLYPIPAAWLIQNPGALTKQEIQSAQKEAAAAGLYVETRSAGGSTNALRNWSTTAGILLALGVLAMTVGLIRSETARDLRTLTATGASSHTRRAITGATAGALAFLGAFIGTAGAYAALLVWYRSGLDPLSRVPVGNLVVILVGLPLIATVAAWLLAGRQPYLVSRQPID